MFFSGFPMKIEIKKITERITNIIELKCNIDSLYLRIIQHILNSTQQKKKNEKLKLNKKLEIRFKTYKSRTCL